MMARLRALGAEGKRRIVQVLAAVLYNANIGGFLKGEIYRGNSKKFCVPGLNCYSCPGAIASCPLGALQASLNSSLQRCRCICWAFCWCSARCWGGQSAHFCAPLG